MRTNPPATLKIAWRDMRSAPAKFLFVILAVAVGVGALTGVRSFSRAFHTLLVRQARTLMAGDLSLRVFGQPTPQQTAAIAGLEQRGVRDTSVTETLTMANTAEVPEPMLVSVKAHRSGSLSFLWRGHPRPAGRSARHPRQPFGRGFRRPAIPAEDARGRRLAARWPGLSHRGAAGIGARPLDRQHQRRPTRDD